jgi:helix-turn-helix protein
MPYSPSSYGSPAPSAFDISAGKSSLEDYAKQCGISGGLAGATQKSVGLKQGLDPLSSAYEIIENIAKRGIASTSKLSESEIQILAAFVLGCNSKPSR